ncbi:hypothetical protein [Hydrogenophaga taeniospiralis]|uniref:hypothetical protein n=1 Tax=Hydrogenophaga taeniospiralis TaxID=65656 RepID=UPI000A07B212|nr:hypothetical protein [Hydrogenophaga taeniospiralis]
MKVESFTPELLLQGFVFPRSYISYFEQTTIPDLSPWWFLCEMPGLSDSWLKVIKRQYPSRQLVPFAKIEHIDDVACFDASAPSNDPIVHYVHTYASPGWEDRGHVVNFDAWLKAAMADAVQFNADGEGEGEGD